MTTELEEQTMSLFRGDTFTFTVTIKDTDGVAFDVSEYTPKFTAKYRQKDTDAQAKIGPITGSIVNGPEGIVIFTLSPTDTNIQPSTYYFDVQISKVDDVHTVAHGKLIIIQDITVEV